MAIESTVTSDAYMNAPEALTSYNGILYVALIDAYTFAKIHLFKSEDAGENWSFLSVKDISSEQPGNIVHYISLIAGSDGQLHILYADFSSYIRYRTYDLGTNTWSAPTVIAEYNNPEGYRYPYYASMSIDSGNQVHVTWRMENLNNDHNCLFYQKQVAGVWQGEELVYQCDEFEIINTYSICVDTNGNPRIFCNGTIGEYDAIFMWSKDSRWDYEVVVSSESGPSAWYNFVSACDYNTGDLYTIFSSSSSEEGMDILWMSRRDYATGEWDEPEIIYQSPNANDFCVGFGIDIDFSGILTVLLVQADTSWRGKKLLYRQKISGVWGETGTIYSYSDPNYTVFVSSLGRSTPVNIFNGAAVVYSVADPDFTYLITKSYSLGFVGGAKGAKITSISPSSGGVNRRITISGNGFGKNQAKSKVIFFRGEEEFEATVHSWSDTSISVYSPEVDYLEEWNIKVLLVDK